MRKSVDDRIVFEKTDFDYVNKDAKVVIVGITPGNNQLEKSREGISKKEIKRENAFAGNMRPNLIAMLDYVGVNELLGIESCRSLWDEDFDKVELTSLLKDATYEINKNGEKVMFKDLKKLETSVKLQEAYHNGFVKDCADYGTAILFIGLGSGVYNCLCDLKANGSIKAQVIGMAHPSGANSGRIACYLGNKEPKDASYLWCVKKAEEAKMAINRCLMLQ